MPVSVVVERHSFFPSPDGRSLRWSEFSPPGSHVHHRECGCTKDVRERPLGDPSSVQQAITLSLDGASLPIGTGWLTFGELGGRHHRYFRFGHGQRSVDIEMTVPGHGLVGCFFAHLYFGHVDTSRFMNGHSPTRLDLSDVGGRHWLHRCGWGKEGVRLLSSPDEAWLWDRAYALHEFIQRASARHVDDVSSPVDGVRLAVESDGGLLRDFERLRSLLEPLSSNVLPTELFRLAAELEAEVYSDD